jgi:hypothetical protein
MRTGGSGARSVVTCPWWQCNPYRYQAPERERPRCLANRRTQHRPASAGTERCFQSAHYPKHGMDSRLRSLNAPALCVARPDESPCWSCTAPCPGGTERKDAADRQTIRQTVAQDASTAAGQSAVQTLAWMVQSLTGGGQESQVSPGTMTAATDRRGW